MHRIERFPKKKTIKYPCHIGIRKSEILIIIPKWYNTNTNNNKRCLSNATNFLHIIGVYNIGHGKNMEKKNEGNVF